MPHSTKRDLMLSGEDWSVYIMEIFYSFLLASKKEKWGRRQEIVCSAGNRNDHFHSWCNSDPGVSQLAWTGRCKQHLGLCLPSALTSFELSIQDSNTAWPNMSLWFKTQWISIHFHSVWQFRFDFFKDFFIGNKSISFKFCLVEWDNFAGFSVVLGK